MTKAYMYLLAYQFHEDTGCYAPGYMPEPETRSQNEENHHRKVWEIWCKGRTRGLSVHFEGRDEQGGIAEGVDWRLRHPHRAE